MHESAWEPTGIESVDGAVERLAALDESPVAEHVAAFESVHASLRSALGEVSVDRD